MIQNPLSRYSRSLSIDCSRPKIRIMPLVLHCLWGNNNPHYTFIMWIKSNVYALYFANTLIICFAFDHLTVKHLYRLTLLFYNHLLVFAVLFGYYAKSESLFHLFHIQIVWTLTHWHIQCVCVASSRHHSFRKTQLAKRFEKLKHNIEFFLSQKAHRE